MLMPSVCYAGLAVSRRILHAAMGESPEESASYVSACIASLKPYPQLYQAVQHLLSRHAAGASGS